jgi:hypothetical protein
MSVNSTNESPYWPFFWSVVVIAILIGYLWTHGRAGAAELEIPLKITATVHHHHHHHHQARAGAKHLPASSTKPSPWHGSAMQSRTAGSIPATGATSKMPSYDHDWRHLNIGYVEWLETELIRARRCRCPG